MPRAERIKIAKKELKRLPRFQATILEPIEKSKSADSKATPTEEASLKKYFDIGSLIEPPYDPFELSMLPEYNTVLEPLVAAMEVNVDGFGYRFELIVDEKDLDETAKAEAKREKIRLKNFFLNCYSEGSFVFLRRITRRDLELTGNAYWEVVRNPTTKEIKRFNHIPSYQMRLGVLDEKAVDVDQSEIVFDESGLFQIKKTQTKKRFRRFVQTTRGGLKLVWFKEFGDTRRMNHATGEFSESIQAKDDATEIIHWKLYSSRSPYGIPRYIGNLITIYGDRAADEINYTTLNNNNIPSLVIFCSGGQLTDGSIRRLKKFITLQAKNSRNYSRILLLESMPITDEGGVGAKLDMKPLVNEQMKDQLFQEYSRNNRTKIRESFRIPPIFTGESTDFSKNTSETSRRLADEQVFSPERTEFDNWINRNILPVLGAKYHTFVSNSPNVTDDSDLISVLSGAEKTGAMTPRVARVILADILNKELPALDPAKIDPDIPFSIQLAEHAKNLAFQTTGHPEPGSQFMTFKSMEEAETIENLLDLRRRLEKELGDRL